MRPRKVMVIALAVMAGQAFGAESASDKPVSAARAAAEKRAAMAQAAAEARRPAEYLPDPLEGVATNLIDLEKSGYFTIESVDFAVPDESDEEAFVWTIKVNRTLTIRHALWLLEGFRDVRFYETQGAMRTELFSAWMRYSPRLAERAGDRGLLREDESFQMWVVAPATKLRMLQSLQTGAVVFQPLPDRHTTAAIR